MQAAYSTPLAPVTPLHSCQAAPLNSCSLVFHQQWPLHCLSQLTPHLLSCEVPPGWRILPVAGGWAPARHWCAQAVSLPCLPPPHTPYIQLTLQGLGYVCEKIHRGFVGSLVLSRKWFSPTDFEELLQLCIAGSCHCVWDPQTKLFLFCPSSLLFSPSFPMLSLFLDVCFGI